MILKYRLFGRDGITNREFEKLVQLGIIKRKESIYCRRYKVKKRITKEIQYSDGHLSIKSSEMSGSDESNFTYVTDVSYEDNAEGDPMLKNEGYEIQPLCP